MKRGGVILMENHKINAENMFLCKITFTKNIAHAYKLNNYFSG